MAVSRAVSIAATPSALIALWYRSTQLDTRVGQGIEMRGRRMLSMAIRSRDLSRPKRCTFRAGVRHTAAQEYVGLLPDSWGQEHCLSQRDQGCIQAARAFATPGSERRLARGCPSIRSNYACPRYIDRPTAPRCV